MQTMHPTLLVGPADWDPRQMPRVEFEERLAALWQSHPNAGGAIVYGNSSDYAALAYLTNFTPKLEAALALIPRHGEAQLLIGGGVNMVPAAKPLTFVENLAPLREAAKTAAAWAGALQGGGALLLIGGDAMPLGMRGAFDQALGSDIKVEVADRTLQAGMRRKRPRELRAIGEACDMLAAAATALRDAVLARKNVTDCILTAEHAALQRGAQDVRSLFSLDRGRTLRPFDLPIPDRRDPLQVYLAARHDGYWAEGFVRVASTKDALQEKVDGILDAMVTSAKPGQSCRELRGIVDQGRGALQLHPLAATMLGSSIGLARDEAPALTPDSGTRLEAGAVYSLRAGLIDDTGAGAVASAMVAVTPNGPDVLWRHGASS
jgi:Xaa-Pro aminopeptidase